MPFLLQYHRIYDALMMLNWNLLAKEEQMAYQFMLNATNNARVLTVANVAPLNANIYLIVNYLFIFAVILTNWPSLHLQMLHRLYSFSLFMGNTSRKWTR